MIGKTKELLIASVGALALCLAAPACVGSVPGGGDDDPAADGGVNPGDPDAGPPPVQALNVTGAVNDYWTNSLLIADIPVEGATVSTEGIDPAISATSGVGGAYSLTNVPVGSVFYTRLTAPANYRPTRTESITVIDTSVTKDLYLVSNADINRQYATVNVIEDGLAGSMIVDMYMPDGAPYVGLAAADVELLDTLGQPALAMGPYFFGLGGDMQELGLVPQSILALGKARVGYLNVPPATYTFRINYINALDDPATIDTLVTIGGPQNVTLSRTMNTPGGGGANNGAYDFVNDVYPILQTGAEGGVGCENCHRLGGLAALLPYDGTPANTYALLMADPTIVNKTPGEELTSLLLMKPLYEDPPNHPNATFATINDPNYMIIMMWITQGAILDKNAL